MRQFGRHELEKNPGRAEPSEQKALGGSMTLLPAPEQRRDDEERSGPETRDRQHRVIAWRRTVRFLATDQLWQEVVSDRIEDETAACRAFDRDQPGRHDQRGD